MATTSDACRNAPGPAKEGGSAPGTMQSLHTEIESRFGVLPNFFRLGSGNPEITANLWGFARFAYLDNPLPSLFKERLFVYLSRFCDVRYCIIRHVGFLTGRGHPSGDAEAPVQSIEEVIKLLRRPLPRGESVEPHIRALRTRKTALSLSPPIDSEADFAIVTCATHVFLQSSEAHDCLAALRHAFDESGYEQLLVFLTFVRTAHYWTRLHEDLVLEDDAYAMVSANEMLAECLLNDPEAESCDISRQLLDELNVLRQDRERHDQLSRAYEAAREIEQRLRQSNAELAAHVAEAQEARSAALEVMDDAIQAKQALWASEQQLREADRRKDEFLATLAHELRNPLAPIASSVQIMRLPGVDSEVIEQARKTIERQVSHLVRLVDDLMDVSRISRDKFELRKQEVALSAVVQSAVETSKPIIDARDQHLHVDLPAAPVWMEADLTRLAQALANLLNNAAKYSPDGANIYLAAEHSGHEVIISVRDTGSGIGEETLPHIFEMFRQGEAADDRSRGGLGIGLTLVKSLVEMHGGSVEAKSPGAGRGSEFVLRLPLLKPDRAYTAPPVHELAAVTARRILVVDDNTDAAASLAMLLNHSGHHARTANDGHEAIEAAMEFRPDAIMLDIGMPTLDGYEVAQQIRQQPWGTEVLLVALTGWGQLEDRTRSKAAGFDHHLVKPVEYEALLRLLGESRP